MVAVQERETHTKEELPIVGFSGPDAPRREDMRRCVHCGLCLAACPTFRVLGSELDSPRGRIFQMRMVAEGKVSLYDPNFRQHMFACLDCRACETACPSGVEYGKLIEATRSQLKPAGRTEALLLRVVLGEVFSHPMLLDVAGLALRFYQKSGLQALARRTGVLKRLGKLGELEGLLPRAQGGLLRPRLPEVLPAKGTRRARVALVSGCVMSQLFGETNLATARVLVENGCEVVTPPDQRCCGALHEHAGERELARQLARHNIEVFEKLGVDAIIINAAGCGSMLKEYGHLLEHDPQYAARARAFSAKVRDINEYLVEIGFRPPKGEIRRRVTYQDACHLRHAQRISEPPRVILKSIPGIELVEMWESDMCCGSAGIYNITNSDISMQLLDMKMDNIVAVQPQTIVASNPGCIIQLAYGAKKRGLNVDVVHPVDLLDEAYRREAGPYRLA